MNAYEKNLEQEMEEEEGEEESLEPQMEMEEVKRTAAPRGAGNISARCAAETPFW
jgi:hypothetical protein